MWQEILHDDEHKDAFLTTVKAAAKQMQAAEQYYQFTWDDDDFGIDYTLGKIISECIEISSHEAYSQTKSDNVPFIRDIIKTVDFPAATKPLGDKKLEHNMELMGQLA